ncbi:MAG: twin transmembrane helix small protein [Betaproteobacteria bacterium]|jgi:hypothetical protein|nr:twin transmembrane helix small protein [Pseudomonadota bacterium]
MRIVVLIFIVLIIASLGSALVYMMKDREPGSTRMVKALALRVGFSITLFLLLMAGYYFGFITQRLG